MHAVLVHGWKGWPENAWFPWLRRELEARGWTTEALKLPDPAFPKRMEWMKAIAEAIRSPQTVLIGHSLGTLAILWTLEKYDGPPITGVVLVSGFGRDFHVPGLHTWFPREPDLDLIRTKAKQWRVVHARGDYLVPFREGQWLARKLDVSVITTKRMGHLTDEERAFEVPEILEATLSVVWGRVEVSS